MIETRRLEKTEWDLLPKESGERLPTAEQCVAVVSFEDKEPIGRAFLLSPVHIEGIWIKPNKRNGIVMKSLVKSIENEARRMKLEIVFAYAADKEMEDYIYRLGYEQLPWTVWRKKL